MSKTVAAMFPKASRSFLEANGALLPSAQAAAPVATVKTRSPLAVQFDGIWNVLEDAPPYVEELAGIDGRRFRFDLAWIHPVTGKGLLVVELEGTTRQGGRHQRKDGFESDAEKYLLASLVHDWQVVRLTRKLITPTYLVLIRDKIRKLQAQ